MNKFKVITIGVVVASVVSASGIGVASALANNSNVGQSNIPKTSFRQERLNAVATVLHTTPSAVQTARKDKKLATLVSQAGLSKKTFAKDVRVQLITDLKAKGYTQDQITIALQHKKISRLHHRLQSHTPKKNTIK